jgi:hypothetical protein
MSISIKDIFLQTVLVLTSTSFLMAQGEDWDEDGAIQDAEVIIEKERQITLENANRGYEKVSPLPLQVNQGPQTYSFDPINYTATPFTPNIRINRIKEQPLSKLYGNYVKGGIGNYGTTYLEGYFNNKRSENHMIGGYIKSLSSSRGPVDKGNSANSEFSLGFDGSYFTESVTFRGAADYQRNKLFYYGYTPGTEVDRDTIKQIYNVIDITLGLEDRKKNEGIDFTLDGKYTSLEDNYDTNEDQGAFNFLGNYAVNDHLKFGLQSDLYLTKRSIQRNSQNRNFFRVRPSVSTQISSFNIEVGVNVVYENDTIQNANKVHVAPVVKASINLSDRVLFYAGISGDVDYRSLKSYIEENPYLGSEVTLSHNIKKFELIGGLKGSLGEELNFHTGLSIGSYDNLAFYATSSTDSTRFDILYDLDNPSIVHFFGELGYSKVENLVLNFRGDLYGYDTKSLQEPWGRPTYSVKASGSYNLYGKLLLGSSLTAMGGVKALNQQSGNTQKLDAIFDLNLSADYLFSPRFSVFVVGKNLISKKYQQYLNYPSRGITVIGGITYSF